MTSTLFARRASALLYRLLAGRRDGRTFLIPANVCAVVPLTFLHARQPFRIVDISASDCSIDERQCLDIVRASGGRVGGVFYVRSYGRENPVDPFFRALRQIQPDLFIIDDRCLGRPDVSGATVSEFADATLYSTGYAKYTDLGSGGFAHVRSIEAAQAPAEVRFSSAAHDDLMVRCRHAIATGVRFGGVPDDWLDLRPLEREGEFRDAVEAATAESDTRKNALNAIYRDGIPIENQMDPTLHQWRFNISVDDPDALVERLFAAGLFAGRHYPSVGAAFGQGPFPVAERIHRRIVNLFNDRYYDAGRAHRTVDVVRAFLQEPTSSRSRSSRGT